MCNLSRLFQDRLHCRNEVENAQLTFDQTQSEVARQNLMRANWMLDDAVEALNKAEAEQREAFQ